MAHVLKKHPGCSDSPSLPHGEEHQGIIWILKIEGNPRIFAAGTDFSNPPMTHAGKVREQQGTPTTGSGTSQRRVFEILVQISHRHLPPAPGQRDCPAPTGPFCTWDTPSSGVCLVSLPSHSLFSSFTSLFPQTLVSPSAFPPALPLPMQFHGARTLGPHLLL